MTASELRIGNWVKNNYDIGNNLSCDTQVDIDILCDIAHGYTFDFEPIELSPDWLERLGFKQLPHYTVGGNWLIPLGRDRVLSVACVGTPNEMIFITEEEPPEVKQIIVARNFDYDGKTYVHHLMNLYHALTGEELITGEKEGV